jgi:tetratricopeptide (TPR) repeat protein
LFLLEQRNWDQAILDYEKIISLDVSNRKRSNAFGGLAMAFEGKGDLQKALLNFSLAIQEDSQSAEVYYNRAWFYSTHGAPDEAIVDADNAILFAPAESRNYTARGNALLGSSSPN